MMENGKKALLVTGGSSDLGRALISSIGDKYACVWGHYSLDAAKLQPLEEALGDKLRPIKADFSSLEETERMIDHIMRSGFIPDHIVHLSAPRLKLHNYKKVSWEDFQTQWDVSFRSLVLLTQAFFPEMAKRKSGKLVVMLSSATLTEQPKFMADYISCKFALLGLLKALSKEYTEKGIRINGVSPDMINTEFLCNLPELVPLQNAEQSMLKRNLETYDVIPAVEYLLSDSGDCVFGQNLGIGCKG